MGMTNASMDAQTKRAGSPGFAVGADVTANVPSASSDSTDSTSAPSQSPSALPLASDAKQSTASTNDGGSKQAPVTGWMNGKKVVATFDGTDASTKPVLSGLDANSGKVVAIKP